MTETGTLRKFYSNWPNVDSFLDRECSLTGSLSDLDLDFFDCYNSQIQRNSQYENISDDDSESSSLAYVNSSFPANIKDWDSTHIMKWILDLYDKANYKYEDLNIHYFKDRDGRFLINLTEKDWNKIDKNRGIWLYQQTKDLKEKLESNITVVHINYSSTDIKDQFNWAGVSDEEQDKITYTHTPKKRGRPRLLSSKPRNKVKVGRIWEFLRDLLKDSRYCPKYICWENYQNLEFRLVNPQQISEIWGNKKNKKITYEHFSRSIRHYYQANHPNSAEAKIQSVPDKRLVYRFNRNVLTQADHNAFVQ